MKLIAILFSTLMVQAILANRKSVTRRTRGLEEINKHPERYVFDQMIDGVQWGEDLETLKEIKIKCPYGQVGDVLWVRESYCPQYFDGGGHGYKADWNKTSAEYVSEPKWKPSIHMPKTACRIWLRITNVRVERLQDISDKDAKEEGVTPNEGMFFKRVERYDEAFNRLWESIHGEESWNSNPWVWVIEFERIEKPIE